MNNIGSLLYIQDDNTEKGFFMVKDQNKKFCLKIEESLPPKLFLKVYAVIRNLCANYHTHILHLGSQGEITELFRPSFSKTGVLV